MNDRPILSSWDVNTAMRDIYDTMEKAVLTGLLLGDVAYQIKVGGKTGIDDPLEVDHIEWGIHKSQLTAEVKSLFKVWGFTPDNEQLTGYTYEVSNVPVHIKVYARKYPFLENFDKVFYGPDEFRIPNQFSKYYKARGIIQ